MPNAQIGKPEEGSAMKKRTVRLPRSNEGGMLLEMPHAAFRGVAPESVNQEGAFS